MLDITYTISSRLKGYLDRIEDLRKQILLEPLSPAIELRLHWEATLDRIYYSLKFANSPLERAEMSKLLSEITHKNINDDRKIVLQYKKSLDHIFQNWQGSQKTINAEAIIDLHKIISDGKLRIPQAGLQALLDYLQTEGENPIIQAAIVCIKIEKMQLFIKNNGLAARLAADLFLSKYGYDLKGLLAYEAAWMKNEEKFKEVYENTLNMTSLTVWLEYFAENIFEQMERIIQSMESSKTESDHPKKFYWFLQERQKSILDLLAEPQTTITNRQVQKICKISQITASRDLAKLTRLGCLLSHGKGRSVYYTRF
jgi:hypothetical protein